MIRRFAALSILPLLSILLCQCGPKDSGPVLVGQTSESVAEGDALFRKAEGEERKGDIGDAIDLYNDVADDYPNSIHAADARFREAKLLERDGDLLKAFKAYDRYLSDFPTHAGYGVAIDRIYQIATKAKQGKTRTNIIGMKKGFSRDQVIEMLEAIRVHAPRSGMAAKAQYAIAEKCLEKVKLLFIPREKKYSEAIAAFRLVAEEHRDHPLAPEAMFRIGVIHLEDAETGNQNQANLNLAREAFNDYLIQFPGHKRNAEARKLMASLNARELESAIKVADYYYKIGQMKSAKIYYRDVAKRTKSGKLHDRAKARLKELEN